MTVVCVRCVAHAQSTPPVADAAFHDMGAIGRLVRVAKRGDWRAGGRVLATLVVVDRLGVVPACDVVTWVPPDRGRRAARGGHLPERFGRALAAYLGVEAVALLRRRGRRPPQRGLGRSARRRNVSGAFALSSRRRARMLGPGVRVLVVDDVRTTGATLAAARATLARRTGQVEALAIVGVDSAAGAEFGRSGTSDSRGARPCRCRKPCTERGNSAQESKRPCRCVWARFVKGSSSLLAPRPP